MGEHVGADGGGADDERQDGAQLDGVAAQLPREAQRATFRGCAAGGAAEASSFGSSWELHGTSGRNGGCAAGGRGRDPSSGVAPVPERRTPPGRGAFEISNSPLTCLWRSRGPLSM